VNSGGRWVSLDGTDFRVVSAGGAQVLVVKARGELDIYSGPTLRGLLTDAIAACPRQVVVDMAEVSFIDSSGLSVIIDAYKRADDNDIDLVLQGPTARAQRLLELTGLNRVLTIVSAPSPDDEA